MLVKALQSDRTREKARDREGEGERRIYYKEMAHEVTELASPGPVVGRELAPQES